jgi:3-dehydrosphinganine reductase
MGPFKRKQEYKPPPLLAAAPSEVAAALSGYEGLTMAVAAAAFVFFVAWLLARRRRGSYSLRGKHVVVTGGSSGIGKAVALQALQAGATITLMARNAPTLEAAKAELVQSTSADAKVFVVAIDVGSGLPAVQVAFAAAVRAAGQEVDVLVNCAGNSVPGAFDALDPAAFEAMMRVNYFGSVYPTRAVVPAMKANGAGRIVFVSSQAGQVGVFGFSAYSPSKFALVGLAQVLRMELQPYGIGVSVAYPPDTDTPGFAEENVHKPEETRLISETAGLFKPEKVPCRCGCRLQKGAS